MDKQQRQQQTNTISTTNSTTQKSSCGKGSRSNHNGSTHSLNKVLESIDNRCADVDERLLDDAAGVRAGVTAHYTTPYKV